MGRATLEPRPALGLVHQRDAGERSAPEPLQRRPELTADARTARTTRARAASARVQNWKDITPRVGVASTCSATAGPRSRRASRVRGRPAASRRPTTSTRRRRSASPTARLGRPRRQRVAARRQRATSSSTSCQTVDRDADLRPERVDDVATTPRCSNGWGERGYNWEYTGGRAARARRRVSLNGGLYRRKFGNQTITVDLRYDREQLRWSVLRQRAGRPEPALRRRRLPGLRPVRSEAVGGRAGPAGQQPGPLLGGLRRRNEHLSGLRRQHRGAVRERRVRSRRHRRDVAHLRPLQPAGGRRATQRRWRPTMSGTPRSIPDGTTACHREDPLPSRLEVARLVHAAARTSSSAARISSAAACRPAAPGRASWRTGRSPTPIVGDPIARPPLAGRDHQDRPADARRPGLRQSQPEPARPPRVEAVPVRPLPLPGRLRRLQRVQQQLAVHRHHHVLDGRHATWLRPTNVLQARFFKIGGQFDF